MRKFRVFAFFEIQVNSWAKLPKSNPCMGAPKARPLRGQEEARGSHSGHLGSSQLLILACYKVVCPPNHHPIWPSWGSGTHTLRPELSLITFPDDTEQNLARFYVYNKSDHFPTQPNESRISRTCPFSIAAWEGKCAFGDRYPRRMSKGGAIDSS